MAIEDLFSKYWRTPFLCYDMGVILHLFHYLKISKDFFTNQWRQKAPLVGNENEENWSLWAISCEGTSIDFYTSSSLSRSERNGGLDERKCRGFETWHNRRVWVQWTDECSPWYRQTPWNCERNRSQCLRNLANDPKENTHIWEAFPYPPPVGAPNGIWATSHVVVKIY